MKKIMVITGSTDGIGKLSATMLAEEKCTVILHGRNPAKLEACIAEITKSAPNADVKGIAADLSNFNDIQKMIAELQQLDKIDVLINNAGIFNSPTDRTADGFDIRFAVNYLAPYHLTSELLPLLKKSEAPRIVNLGSAAQAPVSLEALKGNEDLTVNQAYAQSKLALTMWTFQLAKEHPEIAINVVNPGSLLNTKMANEAYGQHWAPAEKGANIICELALSPEYGNTTGKYFDNDLGDLKGDFGDAHADAYDTDKIEELINCTEDILSKT